MSAVDEAVFAEAKGAVRRLGPHLAAVAKAFASIAKARSDAAAHAAAVELSVRHGEVRVFGVLLSADDAVRRSLEETVLTNVDAQRELVRLRELVASSPRLQRALAAVHPVSFAPPGAEAWARWKAWLRRLPDEDVWGLPDGYAVSLRTLYVPSHYRYAQAPLPRDGSGEKAEAQVDDPRPRLVTLLTQRSESPRLVFVLGDPGVGKSSLARMLASALAEDEAIQPVWIRLRDVVPERALMEEIERVLREGSDVVGGEAGRGVADVLRKAPRLVLLLDGFDELALAGRSDLGSFFLRLQAMLQDGRAEGIVCFGRDTLIEHATATLPEGAQVMTLCPFDEVQVAAWSARWRAATGADFDGTRFLKPPSKQGDEADGAWEQIASQPLLLMLLARIRLEDPTFEPEDEGLAATYRQVIGWCCERHEHERGEPRANELRRFLRVLGYAAQGTTQGVLHMEDVQRAMVNLGVTADVELAESAATRAILSFSVRRSETTQRAWEFLHRSLGEYLAAELLATEINALVAQDEDELGEVRWRVADADLARRWIERFGVFSLSERTRRFVHQIGRDVGAFLRRQEPLGDAIALLRGRGPGLLETLCEETNRHLLGIAEGWSLSLPDVQEAAIANLLRCSVASRASLLHHLQLSRLGWKFVRRLLQVGLKVGPPVPIWFDRLPLSKDVSTLAIKVSSRLLTTFWLRGTFPRLLFDRSDLQVAMFGRADLTETSWRYCNLSACGFELAQLDFAHFEFTQLRHCSLRGASLRSATFYCCDLSETDFRKADLSEAYFTQCDFEGIKAENACFKGAKGLPRSITMYLDEDGIFRKPTSKASKRPAPKRKGSPH